VTDPAPFLSTIILASAGLVAIIGGLLVARFVSLDSDQRGSRKITSEARDRLDSARQRSKAARTSRLDWHAGFFFRGAVLNVVSQGISDPTEQVQNLKADPGLAANKQQRGEVIRAVQRRMSALHGIHAAGHGRHNSLSGHFRRGPGLL